MQVAYWLFWVSLFVALISGVLGFLVMRTVNRGLFRVIFYSAVAAALVFLFLWFFGGSSGEPAPPVPLPVPVGR